MTRERLALGAAGEKIAASHLKKMGYRIVETNYRINLGEIDIIAEQGETLVFVEVKTRVGRAFGRPFDAVTEAKQKQLYRVALHYMSRYGLLDKPARFDVVGVFFADPDGRRKDARIDVLENAFALDSA